MKILKREKKSLFWNFKEKKILIKEKTHKMPDKNDLK